MAARGRAGGDEPYGGWFTLLGECVLVGLLVVVASVPLLTWVAAVCAGARGLQHHLRGEPGTGVRGFARDLRAVLPGTVVPSAVGVAVVTVVAVDVVLLGAGVPGGEVLTWAVVAAGVLVVVALVRAAVTWDERLPWTGQLAGAARRSGSDLVGTAMLTAGVVMVWAVSWLLPPMGVLGIGCLVLAAVAVELRTGRRDPAVPLGRH